jgi:hypothetical protein
LQKFIHNRGKSGPKIRATFIIFKRLPKVNKQPMVENSLNQVTLMPRPETPFKGLKGKIA